MDILTTISTSIGLAKRLREVSKNIEDAEFKNLLADLSSELADLKLEAASLKERIADLQEENSLLKKTSQPSDEKPTGRQWGCYLFADDSTLYCRFKTPKIFNYPRQYSFSPLPCLQRTYRGRLTNGSNRSLRSLGRAKARPLTKR